MPEDPVPGVFFDEYNAGLLFLLEVAHETLALARLR